MNDAKPTCGWNEASPYRSPESEPPVRSTDLVGTALLQEVNVELSRQTVELIGNLDAWADEMRKGQHPVTLTMLRASATLKTLLKVSGEAYVFAAREHPSTQPWRRALNRWKDAMEVNNIVVPTAESIHPEPKP
jgi:hypothetical protein